MITLRHKVRIKKTKRQRPINDFFNITYIYSSYNLFNQLSRAFESDLQADSLFVRGNAFATSVFFLLGETARSETETTYSKKLLYLRLSLPVFHATAYDKTLCASRICILRKAFC